MTAKLLFTDQTERELGAGRMILGREDTCDILLPERDQTASRRHAAIYRDGEEYWIADLGSTNGTFVNGHRLTAPQRLTSGDVVQIGESRLTFLEIRHAPTVQVSPAAAPTMWTPERAATPPPGALPVVEPSAAPLPAAQEAPFAIMQAIPPTPAPQSAAPPPPKEELKSPLPPHHEPAQRARPSERPVPAPAARPASVNVGCVVAGVLLALVGAGLYFGWVQPNLAEYQSGLGQLARGLEGLLGKGELEQQYQMLLLVRVVSIGLIVVGGAMFLYGLLKRS